MPTARHPRRPLPASPCFQSLIAALRRSSGLFALPAVIDVPQHPEDVRSLYKRLGKRPEEQLFFSLKTTDKLEASRRADAFTRRLDALWKAHREKNASATDPRVALATLEAAGLEPGDALRSPTARPYRTSWIA